MCLLELVKNLMKIKNYWLDDGERAYARMCTVMTHNMCYLMESVEIPFELWKTINRTFGVQKEEDDS